MKANIKKKFNELENAREKLCEELKKFDSRTLNKKPSSDKWSVAQVLFHIMNSEKLVLSYMKKKTRDEIQLEKAGIAEWIKSTMLNFYLKMPFKFKAPEAVAFVPENLDPDNLMIEFATVRNGFKDFLESLPEDLYEKKIFKHPITGRMNIWMTLSFIKNHSERHYKQIRRIIN